jgi:hypothetical protein
MGRRVVFTWAGRWPESWYSREFLTDQLWERLEPLLPVRPRRFRCPGRKPTDAGPKAIGEDLAVDLVALGVMSRKVGQPGDRRLPPVELWGR